MLLEWVTTSGSAVYSATTISITSPISWNTAKSAHGSWRLSASSALYYAMPSKYFRNLELPELVA
ncbi:MAG: hypothetical protein GY820_27765 [Gammaproteobacteria bacterium]|nr:hypothetical protein [Gammaproteobacteria bacterium]